MQVENPGLFNCLLQVRVRPRPCWRPLSHVAGLWRHLPAEFAEVQIVSIDVFRCEVRQRRLALWRFSLYSGTDDITYYCQHEPI